MRLLVAGTLCAAVFLYGSAAHATVKKRVDCKVDKCVALTFDDGPSVHTGRLLDLLEKHGARATFFVTGQNTRGNHRLLRRMVQEGHEIGTHTQNHPDLTRLSATRVKKELHGPIPDIEAAGARVTLARPPYGATNAKVRGVMREMGLVQVLWDVDPQDWLVRDARRVAGRILKQTGRGEVVLAHDIHKTTVDAMPKVIKALQKRGYRLVTVSELRGLVPPLPAPES
ncbi:polysaccharide deacetylase family protein [Nonomuraea sp. NPDC050310]|uniref:polysaccharide deacetylase family protein n=1 Tax=unclassified Nonomuraea TaxID=2593643 RepID=UPI0033D87649